MRYFAMLLVAITLVLGGACAAQTVSVLPNAMTQFVDGNGAPYAGGHVYMYVPGTTTPKATYQTPQGTSPNANPITLDANGRAVIWGAGEYRQVLQDAFGVVVWDQLTYASPVTGTAVAGAIWYGSSTGTANAITLGTASGFIGTDGQEVGFLASATNTSSATINASGFGSVLVEKNTSVGLAVLTGGEVNIGGLYYATYVKASNVFVLVNPTPAAAAVSSTYSGVVTDANGAFYFAPEFSAAAFNLVGDGATSNTLTALASAASAATNGADVVFPCGVYKITASPTFAVPAGKRIRIRGGGQDCTELWFSGVNGLNFTFGSVSSSFELDDISITTDDTAYTGVSAVQSYNKGVNQSLEYGPNHTFKDVLFRGHDFYGAKTEYWSTAFYEKNLSNLNFYGGGCFGNAGYFGTCYSLVGDAAAQSYSVAVNFYGTSMGLCSYGVLYGDWVQGVSLNPGTAIVGCNDAVMVAVGGTGSLSGLVVDSTQLNGNTCVVCVNNTGIANVQLTNNVIVINANAIGLRLQGTNYVVTGNAFDCSSTTGTEGVRLLSSFGNGGNVSGNVFQNCGTGFSAPASVTQAYTIVENNQFANNTMDYDIGAGSVGVYIKDTKQRALVGAGIVPCDGRSIYDTWLQSDAGGTPAYNAIATNGATETVALICDGANLRNH